jgi:hypothetical protein
MDVVDQMEAYANVPLETRSSCPHILNSSVLKSIEKDHTPSKGYRAAPPRRLDHLKPPGSGTAPSLSIGTVRNSAPYPPRRRPPGASFCLSCDAIEGNVVSTTLTISLQGRDCGDLASQKRCFDSKARRNHESPRNVSGQISLLSEGVLRDDCVAYLAIEAQDKSTLRQS